MCKGGSQTRLMDLGAGVGVVVVVIVVVGMRDNDVVASSWQAGGQMTLSTRFLRCNGTG